MAETAGLRAARAFCPTSGLSTMTTPSYLVHEDTPGVGLLLKAIITGVLGLTLGLGIWLLLVDIAAASAMLAVTVADAVLFNWIMPRRYQIWSDRLRIVLGWPFALNVPLEDIAEAREASGWAALGRRGLRLAPSTTGVVVIVRRRGLDVVISPSDRDVFLDRLNTGLEAVRKQE